MSSMIVLCGREGAGKDTVADYLVAKHNFQKLTLADEVRRLTARVTGFSFELLSGATPTLRVERETTRHPLWNITPRSSLQIIATALREECGEDYWLKKIAPKLNSRVVISDCRLLNELEFFTARGAKTWHIARSPELAELQSDDILRHESSWEFLLWSHDHLIINDDLEKMKKAVTRLVKID